MKNRVLKLLILVLTLALCSGVFTACKGLDFLKSVVSCGGDAIGEIIHKHEYSNSYSYDDGYHWFECECGEDKSKEKHILVDGVCVCGYKNDKDVHSHDYNVLKFDETNHWNECECGEKSNVEAHKGGTATETEKAVCEVCNQTYGEILDHVHNYEPYVLLPNCYAQGYTIYTCACGDYYAGDYVPALGHDFGEYVTNGNGTHTKVCANDNSHTETENCSGGQATETQKAVCVVCNGEYGTVLVHTHNYTQTVTAPTCENKGYTTYTCACGDSFIASQVNALGHNYGAFTSNGNGTHTKVCANDNNHKITENCSGGVATETQKAVCVVCNGEYGTVLVHTHNYAQTVTAPTCENKGYTTYTCACGDSFIASQVNALGHNYGAFTSNGNGTHTKVCANDNTHVITEACRGGIATCIEKAICKDCGARYGNANGHSYTNNVCDNCGAIKFVFGYVEETAGVDNQNAIIRDYATLQTYCNDNRVSSDFLAKYNAEFFKDKSLVLFSYMYTSSANDDNVKVIKDYAINGSNFVINVEETTYKHHKSIMGAAVMTYTNAYCEIDKTLVSTCTQVEVIVTEVEVIPVHYYTALKFDEQYHWNECSCGAIDGEKVEHSGGTATCTQKSICKDCNQAYGDYAAHNYSTVITAPTCTVMGYTTYTCACGYSYIGDYVNVIDHNYQNGTCIWCGAESYTEGLVFSLINSNTEYSVTDYNGTATEVYIPSIYNGKPVTSIANYAFYDCDSLTSVTFGENSQLTSIGDYAFYYCSSLENIVIPCNVTTIGDEAFCGCDWLTNVILGSKVNTIGELAFSNCYSLMNIEIPSSVTIIGFGAFNSCSSLERIIIPSSVIMIGNYAFDYCNSLTIYCEAESQPVTWNNGWNLSNCPVVWGYVDYLKIFTVNSTGETITGLTDYGKTLTEITIPNKINGVEITEIGVSAFYNCSLLTSIEIPESVTRIEENAFLSCTSLAKVNYCGSVDDWVMIWFYNGVFGFYSNPICYAKNLYINNELVTDVKLTKATKISDYAFYNCDSLTSIEISESVTSIGYNAFKYCDSLTSIEISSNVSRIGSSAFYGCSVLTSVTFGENSQLTYIGSEAFRGCELLNRIIIPKNVTSIGEYVFTDCKSLIIYCEYYDSNWDENWNYLGGNIESGYSKYVYIDGIMYGLTYEGVSVVKQAKNIETANILSEITYKGNIFDVIRIGDSAFSGCAALISVEIPSKVITIGEFAFSNCDSLTNIFIPKNVTNIGKGSFCYCNSLQNIKVDTSNTKYKDIEGNLYTKNEETLIQYAIGKTSAVFEIPDSVINISFGAFSECISLTNVKIGKKVTSIGDRAFNECESLKWIVIPSTVTNVGNGAFWGCYSINIYCEASSIPSGWNSSFVPIGVPIIKGYSFAYIDNIIYGIKNGVATVVCQFDRNLTAVKIPSDITYNGNTYRVTSIGDSAFALCFELVSIEIPNTIKSIDIMAFTYGNILTKIDFKGTKAQWDSISKHPEWNYWLNVTVCCSDGNISI